MRQAIQTALGVIGGSLTMAALIHFAAIEYREITVQMALSRAKEFSARLPKSRSSDDRQPLQQLRPHPWSSPLNNRRFDNAIAGARAAYDADDYDRAIALNTEALALHPSDDLVWLLLGRRGDCYLEKNEADKALADYEQAARLGGFDSQLQIGHAFALRLKGKRDEALKDFEAAIASNPNDASPYLSRARSFAQDGNLDAALSDYEKALELNPTNISVRLRVAEIYLQQKKSQVAITQASIALKINSNSAAAHIVRAKAYAQLRMKNAGLTDLDTATRLNPGDASSFNAVAWCRATSSQNLLRDGQKAVADATKACQLDQWKQRWCIGTLAAAYAEAGDFDQAIKYQKQALRMMPPSEEDAAEKQRLHLYESHMPYREDTKL